MQVPLEISYRNIRKTDAIETLVRNKVEKLEKICDNITSCRTAIEKPQKAINGGNPFRVRISVRIPHGKEIVYTKEPGEGDKDHNLDTVIRDSFERMGRKLKSAAQKQRNEVKSHGTQVEDLI